MLKGVKTRFRAYQLGSAGSSFSYFADGHFTLLEARLTDTSEANIGWKCLATSVLEGQQAIANPNIE
jgi:competence protein ComEC